MAHSVMHRRINKEITVF